MAETHPNTENQILPEQWVDRYGNYLYRYALTRVPDAETAQELVQEAFVAAVAAFKRFKGQSSLKTWLVAILKRKIVDFYRRQNTRAKLTDAGSLDNAAQPMFDNNGHWHSPPQQWQVNPQAAYEQKEFMDVLYDCLAQLPKRLSEIFMLRELEELTTEAICEQMKISEANSWVMLHRARLQLKKCLERKWLANPTVA